MDESDSDPGSYPIPPASVHLASFSSLTPPPPARLLLSRHVTRRTRPLQSSPPLAYLSLQGLLDEASSARSIGGGGLSREEALAWELFTPYQRFLIVAVIGVAKKSGVIAQLQNSVDLRDQLLSGMQQKLDALCKQLNHTKDQSGNGSKVVDLDDDLQSAFKEKFGSENVKKIVECGCWLCDQHHHSSPSLQVCVGEAYVLLSDWCSSDTTAAEMHFDNLSLDQDMLSLRKECQEKDETIKDLTSFLQLTNKAGSKRETELEEIIRRKKTIIKKLKRDVLVLEEKLTRPRRWSCSAAIPSTREFPMRLDNLLYDMDVSTASSASDSETPANTPRRTVLEDVPVDSIKEKPSALGQSQKSAPDKSLVSLVKAVEPPSVVSPSPIQKPVSVSSSSPSVRRASSSSGDSKKHRRPVQVGSSKRWV
ncbi:hypothetical protein Bca52824_005389 [Brassica carinata]|uniref:Uncharacterized protein n=1 Tax=Brassica carinata TaxID=52824 RepID=A0A8X8BD11_BRACI|nr:hypothetical protein Bca52824_005389 [Brassica carinata]